MPNSMQPVLKDKLIETILKKANSKDANEQCFLKLVLETMSIRTLDHISQPELLALVKDRYKFFKESSQEKLPTCRLIKSPYSFEWIKDQYIFEIIAPDAPFLFQTLENLLLKEDVRITRKLHPIIGLMNDDQICAPSENIPCLSCIFFSFEAISERKLKLIQEKMLNHCRMVVVANQAKEPVLKLLSDVLDKIQSSTPHLVEPKEEWVNLLNWLQDMNFSFFGARHVQVKKGKIQKELSTALGILASPYQRLFPELNQSLETYIQQHETPDSEFQFDRLKCISPIQRFEPLMHLRFAFGDEEYHLVGLLRRSSLLSKNIHTPLIHLKMQHIIDTRKLLKGSHDYNEVLRIFTAIPKYELFRSSQSLLAAMIDDILSITNPNHIQSTFHLLNPKFLFCLMVIPPFMFTVENIEKINGYINEQIPNIDTEILQIQAEGRCRLHIYLHLQKPLKTLPDPEIIERNLGDLLVPWSEKVKLAIYHLFAKDADRLLPLIDSLPDHYSVRTRPTDAAEDLHAFSLLTDENPVEFRLKRFNYPASSDLANKTSILKVFSLKKIDLITIMPILQNLGFYVIDELTARFVSHEHQHNTLGFILSFRVQDQALEPIDESVYGDLITCILSQIFRGEVENDAMNQLLLAAKLSSKQIAILILYRNFYVQLTHAYSKFKITSTLVKHPKLAAFLVRTFIDKFDLQTDKIDEARYKDEFKQLLKSVDDLSEDTIFRQLFALISCTVRSNYFQDQVNGDYPFAIKCHPRSLSFIPNPKPEREIYVYDRLVEGVHLRFGAVARGGIRWSDRDDDFRTEILGLVKTQQVKNVVIVPVGSKGGFIAKKTMFYNTPSEIEFHYKRFVKGLLSITDNRQKDQVIHPAQSKIYDEKDPYFVIAADKGTAKFSDVANAVSQSRGFWLDDAFASGGSYGYDHKKVGITAKGAWACGLRHFLEQNWAPDKVLTCVGIGDMSGDVFGNGMLLSQNIKLLAAFNHAHIFVDPQPDPKTSFKERDRLFKLPRSTWKDYDATTLSKGAGIFDRSAKEIQLSKTAMEALGISSKNLSGQDLIKAILRAPVDFIWFGGIGTYMKADFESQLAVADPGNDDVRINASEARATIIVEGANLGLTQKARLQYSLRGGKINTDAIDNSAGVNMSDYEVNLKILMRELMAEGSLTLSKRNTLLETYTDAVTEKVLDNNDHQHQLISLDQIRSTRDGLLFKNLIESLVQRGSIDQINESIPDSKSLEEWVLQGIPCPRPLLAVLQAYIKMEVLDTIISTQMMQDPHFETLLFDYFPKAFSQKYKADILKHPLRDHIIATVLSNRIVNYAGSGILYHLNRLTGAGSAQIITTYLIIESISNAIQIRSEIRQSKATVKDQYEALLYVEDIIGNICRSLLQSNLELPLSAVKSLEKLSETLLKSSASQRNATLWIKKGFTAGTAESLARLPELESLPEAVYINHHSQLAAQDVCVILQKVNQTFKSSWIETQLKNLHLESYWEKEQQNVLRSTLFDCKCQLVLRIKKQHSNPKIKSSDMRDLLGKSADTALNRYLEILGRLEAQQEPISLSSLSVLVAQLQALKDLL